MLELSETDRLDWIENTTAGPAIDTAPGAIGWFKFGLICLVVAVALASKGCL